MLNYVLKIFIPEGEDDDDAEEFEEDDESEENGGKGLVCFNFFQFISIWNSQKLHSLNDNQSNRFGWCL